MISDKSNGVAETKIVCSTVAYIDGGLREGAELPQNHLKFTQKVII